MSVIKSPKERFFDQSYSTKLGDLSLFIEASSSRLLFAYFDSSQKKFIGLEERIFNSELNWHQLSEELIQILKSDSYKADFKSVSLSVVNSAYTLVPSSLYKESKLSSYLSLNHPIQDQSGLAYKAYEVTALNTYVVYAYPEILKKAVDGLYNHVAVSHYTAPLLESFALNSSKKEELQLEIHQNCFDILYSVNGKLQFLNSFVYHTVEDFIYYLLYVMEQLEIDRNHIELNISGDIEEHSALYNTLFKYIRHPQLIGRSNSVQYSQPLNLIPVHKYRNLFNQYLCA